MSCASTFLRNVVGDSQPVLIGMQPVRLRKEGGDVPIFTDSEHHQIKNPLMQVRFEMHFILQGCLVQLFPFAF